MYEAYVKLKPNELHDHLKHKRKLHPKIIEVIRTEVSTLKESKRRERITRTVRTQAWQELIQPLRYELNNAKVGRNYKGGEVSPQRTEAFDAYITVMEKLLAKLTVPSTTLTLHPATLAKERNATGKGSPIPNNGQHWTDWIPAHIKNAIADAFTALPYKAKAKRKIPFQRTTTATQHTKAKAKLIKRTQTELANAERLYQLNPTKENGQLITRIDKALKIIETLDPNEVVPHTWHGVEITTEGESK
jgi:hypothetical protein